MELRRHAIEYAHWTYSGAGDAPIGTMELSLDGGTTWLALEADGTDGLKILVAGPDADTPGTAVVLATGAHVCIIRNTDSPEVIPRGAGYIHVLTAGY